MFTHGQTVAKNRTTLTASSLKGVKILQLDLMMEVSGEDCLPLTLDW